MRVRITSAIGALASIGRPSRTSMAGAAITRVAGEAQLAGVGERHEQPGRVEGRQHHGGDDLDDVADAVGLGECLGVGQHPAGLFRAGQIAGALERGVARDAEHARQAARRVR